jgi:DNA-binding NarL/FixJ family response regulator
MNQPSNPIKIIIADDHQLFVEGIISMFSSENSIKFIAKTYSGNELLREIITKIPDVILLDIKMPGLDGVSVLKQIKEKYSGIKVIMLSTYSDFQTINNCIKNGADGYFFKNTNYDELRAAILGVMNNQTFFPMELDSVDPNKAKFEFYAQTYKITKKEFDIMHLIKDGYTNQKISETLFRSVFTIDTHRKNIIQKLNLKTSGALAKFLIENNF